MAAGKLQVLGMTADFGKNEASSPLFERFLRVELDVDGYLDARVDEFPMITFRQDQSVPMTSATPIYVTNDYAFSAEPRPEGCALSVSMNELQLMVDEDDRRVVFVEGYCPHFGWKARTLVTPIAHQTGLIVAFDEEPVPGVSRRVSGEARWSTFADPHSGWICIGEEASPQAASAVEFARNTIAVLDRQGRLSSLWLRPANLPKGLVESLAAG